MTKICFISLMAVLPALVQSQTYLNCDFEQGIPQAFELIDKDALTPSSNMQELGFTVGQPWITLTPKGEKGLVACSTSWYMEAGTSDDWMILPPLTIADDDAILRWRAKAFDKKHRDGYIVYVASTTQTSDREQLQWEPLFATEQEESSWTLHVASLDAYKGHTIRLAFVNNSTDKSRLFIDDIYCGVQTDMSMKVNLGEKTFYGTEAPVSGSVTNTSVNSIEGFTVELATGQDSAMKLQQYFPTPLNPGESANFLLDKKLPLPFHERVDYTITAIPGSSADGSKPIVLQSHTTSYPRHVVCEEGTGTWCGWCVRGLVMLDSLHHNASDWAVCIAAHNGDPMACSYEEALSPFIGNSYPSGIVNRLMKTDPGMFASVAREVYLNEECLVAMDASATLDEESGEASVTASMWFADSYEQADYRIALSIIENDVHVPDNPRYAQNNAYSGGASGPMGGYENKPSRVPASEMWYQHVARGFVDELGGVQGSIPTTIAADEEIMFSKTFALPDGILNVRNCRLVVMIVDQSDSHIANAVEVPFSTSGATAIQGIEEDKMQQQAGHPIYDLEGRRLGGIPERGVYIMNGRKYVW